MKNQPNKRDDMTLDLENMQIMHEGIMYKNISELQKHLENIAIQRDKILNDYFSSSKHKDAREILSNLEFCEWVEKNGFAGQTDFSKCDDIIDKWLMQKYSKGAS